MKRRWAGQLLALALVSGTPVPSEAEDRMVPFWPQVVTDAIHAEIDGGAALRTVRDLGRFHRVHGSPGFAAAAEMMRERLVAAGLADAAIERFPADGQTRYAHFRSYLGWTPNRFRWSSRLRRLHYGDKKRTATWRPTNMSSGFGHSPKKFIGSCAPTEVLSSISAALGIPAVGRGRFSSMS